MWRHNVEIQRDVARSYAAIAAQDWRSALAPLARADERARQIRHGRLHIELMGLRALALERCGEVSHTLIHEAMDLARAYGLRRVFADAHPDLGVWVGSSRPKFRTANPGCWSRPWRRRLGRRLRCQGWRRTMARC